MPPGRPKGQGEELLGAAELNVGNMLERWEHLGVLDGNKGFGRFNTEFLKTFRALRPRKRKIPLLRLGMVNRLKLNY